MIHCPWCGETEIEEIGCEVGNFTWFWCADCLECFTADDLDALQDRNARSESVDTLYLHRQ